jgi:hypothetical protein
MKKIVLAVLIALALGGSFVVSSTNVVVGQDVDGKK